MSVFGNAAVAAARRCIRVPSAEPRTVWTATVRRLSTGPSMPGKCCPKGAFLGLHETGQIRGIPRSRSKPSNRNGAYALAALKILRSRKGVPNSVRDFWAQIPDAPPRHNEQLTVVLALWTAKLLWETER